MSVRGFSDPGCVLDNSSLYTQTDRGPKILEKEPVPGRNINVLVQTSALGRCVWDLFDLEFGMLCFVRH